MNTTGVRRTALRLRTTTKTQHSVSSSSSSGGITVPGCSRQNLRNLCAALLPHGRNNWARVAASYLTVISINTSHRAAAGLRGCDVPRVQKDKGTRVTLLICLGRTTRRQTTCILNITPVNPAGLSPPAVVLLLAATCAEITAQDVIRHSSF